MNDIFKSASKIILLFTVGSLGLAFLFLVFTRQVEPGDIVLAFIGATSSIVAFYTANKGTKDDNFLGK